MSAGSTLRSASETRRCNTYETKNYAQTEGRTRIPVRVRDFESRASASSAIWAYIECVLNDPASLVKQV